MGGLVVITACVSLSKDVVLNGRLPDALNVAFHVVFIVAASIGAITRAERYHNRWSW